MLFLFGARACKEGGGDKKPPKGASTKNILQNTAPSLANDNFLPVHYRVHGISLCPVIYILYLLTQDYVYSTYNLIGCLPMTTSQ